MPNLLDFKTNAAKRRDLGKKLVVAGGVLVVGGAYIWHRRKLDAAITAMQVMANNSADAGFENGVKHGIELAAEVFNKAGLPRPSDYAFAAFDKPA